MTDYSYCCCCNGPINGGIHTSTCATPEVEKLHRFVAEVDKAFESNKNFMWGKGKWAVLSKICAARTALKNEKGGKQCQE